MRMKRYYFAGIESGQDRRMLATEVLQKCPGKALHDILALRSRVPTGAIEAMISGRRLTLIDLARAWPDAQRNRVSLKALDRLLDIRHLHAGREKWSKTFSVDDGAQLLVGAIRQLQTRAQVNTTHTHPLGLYTSHPLT